MDSSMYNNELFVYMLLFYFPLNIVTWSVILGFFFSLYKSIFVERFDYNSEYTRIIIFAISIILLIILSFFLN